MAKKAFDTKEVRNRSGHRVEIMIDGNVVVLLPGSTVEVPIDAVIPDGIGLIVR